MNKRIKELAEQCATPERFDVAKFAELIVRECAQKLENDGMVEVAMEIKQQFGVGE
jgi:hypothetical protein